jgi:hypothetical protein
VRGASEHAASYRSTVRIPECSPQKPIRPKLAKAQASRPTRRIAVSLCLRESPSQAAVTQFEISVPDTFTFAASRSFRSGDTTAFEEVLYAYDVLGRLVAAQSIHPDAAATPAVKVETTGFALQGSQVAFAYSLATADLGKITSANFVGAYGQKLAVDPSYGGQVKDIQKQFSTWQYDDLEGQKFTDGDRWGAAGYRFTPGKIEMDLKLLTVDLAYKTWDAARDFWSSNAPQILGTVQAIGGALQIGAAIGACFGIVTCGAGIVIGLHGLDDLVTGLDTAASGQFKDSYTHQGIESGARQLG